VYKILAGIPKGKNRCKDLAIKTGDIKMDTEDWLNKTARGRRVDLSG